MVSDWKKRWILNPHPIVVGILFVASLALLWHGWQPSQNIDTSTQGMLVQGTITKIIDEKHVELTASAHTSLVQDIALRLDNGRTVTAENDLTPLSPGDRIYLEQYFVGTSDESYVVLDYKRAPGIGWLVAGFIVAVLLVSGWRKGAFALVGTVLSIAVIFGYVVPTMLHGGNGLVVGAVAAAIILVGTFYVTYGFNRMSLAALIGIAVTLTAVAGIGVFTTHALHFTGFGDESVIYLNQDTNNGVDIVGLLVAGIIIAAIGVLDDVAVTQASVVFELAQASGARGWKLFAHGMRIGRDHIGAVINTLVLAYAGAALPLILLLDTSNFPFGFTIGGEQVAQEIVRTLVSSLGLVLAVPLTTAVAVMSVNRWGPGHDERHHH